MVDANQNGNNLTIKWYGDLDKIDTYFEFVIDSIKRFKEDSEIEVKWNGGSIGVGDNNGSSKIKIPGKNNFTVFTNNV